ncbi:Xylose isomerase-like TIM barrel [Rubellimicrobium thermophilum DSM 16684]|uniref:Xylose isomerase-like TIM barrel n=1 Tax=Rubellimicrobium thermophilum DSM 16684 TaxID=1123069 RepID=S9S5N5_9RHOB|nr:Xylose isomerase-like TIM barrel [Rubellimicrobium thermophilum]EPX85495.1 Xylose isomerase-like TIM barrel [Rubellimicrobium thermophilum DSM 16684]
MPIIAYQLYCSRNFPPLEDTLAMLAGQGWKAVEGYGALYGDAPALRAALDRHGLSMPSGHFALAQLEEDPRGMIAAARTLGIGKVIVPWIEPDRRGSDPDSWRAFAATVARALEPFRAEGFAVGWHNHDWDLADLGDGSTPTDLMAKAGLGIELDLGWGRPRGAGPGRLAAPPRAPHPRRPCQGSGPCGNDRRGRLGRCRPRHPGVGHDPRRAVRAGHRPLGGRTRQPRRPCPLCAAQPRNPLCLVNP